LSNSLLNSVNELLEIISSLLLFLSTIFAKYFIFWFFTSLTVTEDWLEEDWLESWFLKIDIISLLTTFEVLGIDDDVSAEEELDEEELGGSKEFRAEELDEEELGGSKEFREELDTEELGPEESVKGLEVGGEELDEEELGGSKEFRREELDEEELEEEEFDEGEEPIPCINESIVLSIIFPLPTLFKRLFISVSMFVGLETLSDCE
jgi:hypothetical protein